MTPTSHPPKPLKLLLAAVAAASLVACSSGGSEQQADTKSSPGAVSSDQATDTTDTTDATDTTADGESGATTTTTDDESGATTTTEPGSDPDAQPEVLGSSTGQHPADPNDGTSVPLRLDVVAVERQPGEAVEVRFTLTNESADATFEPYSTLSEAGAAGSYDVAGAALVDLPGDKRYLALRDTGDVCLCTGVNNVEIAPGTSLDAYVQVPAPPEEATMVDFTLPGFAPVNGLEIR